MKAAPGRAPRISVIIAAYNAEQFLGEAIESVLAQTLPPVELIVVDDGSSDGTGEVARSYREVDVMTQENRGPSAARNAAVARSTGDLITFLDADDLMAPRRLELQAAYLEEHPDAGVVFGRQEVFLEPDAEVPYWVEGSKLGSRLVGPADIERIYHMSMFLPRSTWERVGPFDETMRMAEDLDWTMRARELGMQMGLIESVVVVRRVHTANVTHDAAGTRLATFLAFRKRIERNRSRR